MSIGVMLFNPFTGKPRHPSDIESDPHGILIWDGEEPLKTQKPKREWQGLTDDEITKSHSYSRTRDKGCFHAGALWAQEKLKEKNT